MAPPHVNYDEAEQRGWTIVRGMFPPELCARLRACVDDAVGATRPLEVSATPQLGMDIDRALELRIPVVDSQSFRHTVRQPIFDSALAEAAVAGNMIEMQQRLYSASDGLRLMQQMLVRTDADPAAVAAGRSEPGGWHMDTAFLPRHYASSPQTNVFHVLTALNDVPRGGAALHIVPSAFRQCKAYTEKHMDELEGLRDSDFRTVLRPRLLMEAVQDTSECVEVLLSEGDSCVFDLMSTHSAASNCIGGYLLRIIYMRFLYVEFVCKYLCIYRIYIIRSRYSRYVLFQTFFDLSASYALLPARGASALPKKFPSEFRDALPSHLHYLLDWQYPLDGGEVKGKFWGLSREDLEKRSAGEVVTERPAAFRRASAQENKPRL